MQGVLAVLAQSVDAVVVADENGRVILFNPAAALLWGFDAAHALGMPLHEFIPCPVPPWRGDDPVAVGAYLASIQGRDGETLIRTIDGSLRRTTMSLSLVDCGARRLAVAFLRPMAGDPRRVDYLELLARVADDSDSAIFVSDATRQVVYVNRGFEQMFGYTLDDLTGLTPTQLLSGPHTDPDLDQHVRDHLATGAALQDEILLYARSGTPVWVSTAITPVHGADGELTGLVSVLSDTRTRMYQRLHRKALDAMAGDLPLAEVMTVICREVEHIAPELVVLVNAVDTEARQRSLAGPSLPPGALTALDNLPMSPRGGPTGLCGWRGRPVLIEDLRTDPVVGAHHETILDAGLVSCWVNPITSSDGRLLGTLAFYLRQNRGPDELQTQLAEICLHVCALAMERKQSADRMHQLAFYDPLTGLPNRIMFGKKAAQALAQLGGDSSAAVLLIALDRFKHINDAQGHAAGDALVCGLARRLTQDLGSQNVIGRYASDEFVVLLPHCSAEQAGSVAERLLGVIAAPMSAGQLTLRSSASVGVAMYPNDGCDIESLMPRAEMATARSKADGGASFMFFRDDMQRLAQERVALESALVAALREDGFTLHFQPQVKVCGSAGYTLYGVEALARWIHPELGEIQPERFIQVAEATGLVDELSRLVLRQACAQLADWRRRQVPIPRLAVNMSAINFRDPELATILRLNLAEFGLRPSDLTVEITESVMLDPDPDVLFNIEAIYAMGVCLSLDDFGTGYSSLSHLHRLPIHELKLDKSFVRDIDNSAIARTLTTSVLRIGESLGMAVVAEGVETDSQHHFLAEQGCLVLQGYLLSRPLPAEALEQWLQTNDYTSVPVEARQRSATRIACP
jgi:diguanylate cyclase (GGDEF)-like protein/PAS domain S-box-containing protein